MARTVFRTILLTVIGIGIIAGNQYQYDRSAATFQAAQKKAITTLNQPLVPGLTALKLLSLGDRQLTADLLWLNTIQYFGSGDPYGSYAALGPMLDRITQLDPQFEYPYEFALVVLPYMGQTDTAIAIGERAQKELPGNGLLTYYLATDYHLNKKDYRKAAEYYRKAADQPDAPGAALRLAAVAQSNLGTSINDRQVAIAFWETVKERAQTDDDAKRAEDWVNHLQLVITLEQAAQTYHDRHGQYPQNFTDLQKDGLISETPVSPIGRKLVLNPQTGKVDYSQLAQ